MDETIRKVPVTVITSPGEDGASTWSWTPTSCPAGLVSCVGGTVRETQGRLLFRAADGPAFFCDELRTMEHRCPHLASGHKANVGAANAACLYGGKP